MADLTFPKRPSFGSSLSVKNFTLTRRTLGGQTKQVRDSGWPKAKVHNFIFENLTKTEKDDLKDFILANVGKRINVKDTNKSRLWYGMITSPKIAIEQIYHNTSCSLYRVEFEFEGELI